ncbi:MAG: FAD-dependent oxidoreductase, partial [Burkholderiaceae bacterium]
VGAGLCGALAAAALARRGWQVKVLEAAPEPAAGASGLPVGLLAPIASRDDNIRSRLSRAGVRATLEICHALLQAGQDWSATGVLEQRPDAGSSALLGSWRQGNVAWSEASHAWSEAAPAWPTAQPDGVAGAQHMGPTDDSGATWHSRAGWIKPARLVRACLRQSGVTFEGGRKIHALRRNGDEWRLLDVHGSVLAQAPQVVLACTADCVNLLDSARADSELLQSSLRTSDFPGEVTSHPTRLDTMVAVAGQVSWDWQHAQEARTFPPFPVNGSGSFVPHVPIDGARAWFAGATYSTMPFSEGNVASAHLENLQRLSTLLPEVAKALRVHFADGDVKAWVGTRYTTADRLPVVGAPDCAMLRGLWVSTGMGSRGLTFAALAAELLAARLGGEPLPMEARLARSLAIERGS